MKKLSLSALLVLLYGLLYSQHNISGQVKNLNGEPLPNATIFIPALQTGAQSDSSGSFRIEISHPGNLIIQVSHLGYKTKVISTGTGDTFIIILEPSANEIQQVTITSSGEKLPSQYPYPIEIYSAAELNEVPGVTLMSRLAYKPGIDRISTGIGIGKPVIRGNSFNRIVLQAMGTRIENQQWDDRHDLGISESGIEGVEVIQGPAALIYGADALGGALIFIDEKPVAQGKSSGDLSVGYNMNNRDIKLDGGYKTTNKSGAFLIARVGGNLSASYKQGGDAPAGSQVGKYAANSKFIDASGKLSAGINKSWGTSRLNYSYFKQLIGIVELEPDTVIEDEAEQKKWEVEAPFQDVTTHIISFQNSFYIGSGRLLADVAYQLNDRKEFEPLNNGIRKAKEKFIGLRLNVLTYDLKWVSNSMSKYGITIGSQGMRQQNSNNGRVQLVPDAEVNNVAAYITGRYDFKKINFLAGIRVDYRTISLDKRIPEGLTTFFPVQNINKNYTPVSGSAGISWHPAERLTVKLNAATGFSAPNYAELAAYGRHEGAYRFEIGNPELNMEQNIQGDVGVTYEATNFTVNAEAFHNAVKNYIYISNSGQQFMDLPVYYFNQGDAILRGGAAGVSIHPEALKFLKLDSDFSYTRGTLTNPDRNLPYIPAAKLINSLSFATEKRIFLMEPSLSFIVSHYFEQEFTAPFEIETGSYTLLDIMIQGKIKSGKKNLGLQLYASNILDEDYYSHLSLVKNIGIKDMGRNIGFRLTVPF
jgi:iron complex outermembrane recepter protein